MAELLRAVRTYFPDHGQLAGPGPGRELIQVVERVSARAAEFPPADRIPGPVIRVTDRIVRRPVLAALKSWCIRRQPLS